MWPSRRLALTSIRGAPTQFVRYTSCESGGLLSILQPRYKAGFTCADAPLMMPQPFDVRSGRLPEGQLGDGKAACGVQNAADSALFSEDDQSPPPSQRATAPTRSPFASIAVTSSGKAVSGGCSSSEDGNNVSPQLSGRPSQFESAASDSSPPRRQPPRSGSAMAGCGDGPLPIPSPDELLSPHQRKRRLLQQQSLELRQQGHHQGASPPLGPGQPGTMHHGLEQPLLLSTTPQPHPRLQPRRSSSTALQSKPPQLDSLTT